MERWNGINKLVLESGRNSEFIFSVSPEIFFFPLDFWKHIPVVLYGCKNGLFLYERNIHCACSRTGCWGGYVYLRNKTDKTMEKIS
jgi:hypothetical protein